MDLVSKSEFSKLLWHQKLDLAIFQGKYIGVRQYYQQTIELYLYNDYFFEIWFITPTRQIRKIELLEKEKTLNLYIDTMNKLDKE